MSVLMQVLLDPGIASFWRMPVLTVLGVLAILLQPPPTMLRCYIEQLCGAPGADAGATYEKLAAVHLKLDSKHEAASSYMEAAKCYQKTDKKGAPHLWLGT